MSQNLVFLLSTGLVLQIKVSKFYFFLSLFFFQLSSQFTRFTIFNPNIKFKTKLSKNNIHLRGNQYLITYLDRQPLCCLNTFYKQFIPGNKLIITPRSQKPPRPQAITHSTTPPPRRRGGRVCQ